jgi:flagellar motility protein MotE (MotC chaperone)
MTKSQLIQIILGIKLVAIVVIVLTLKGNFYIGDRRALAEKTATPAAAPAAASAAESAAAATSGSNADQKAPAPEAKDSKASILSELLDLPTIKPEEIKRQELGRFLELAEKKHKQVKLRLEELDKRERRMTQIEATIEDKIKRLEDEKKFILETLQVEKTIQEDRLKKLMALYEKMEPKKAAPVFSEMDKDLAIALFNRISQKQITRILEQMSADKSVQLTEYFGRVRSGREYELLREVNKSLTDEFEKCKEQ